MTAPALSVTDLHIATATGDPIVTGLSVTLDPGEMLALIGESGSGKTTTALALLGWANPGTAITHGRIVIGDTHLLGRPERETRRLRSRLVSYVPQDPARALNPARRVGPQLTEILTVHGRTRDQERAICRALDQVQLPTDRRFRRRFPHQLSGGQRQRLTIAQALLLQPRLIVLDEPTTGLDALTQHELLTQLDHLRTHIGAAMVTSPTTWPRSPAAPTRLPSSTPAPWSNTDRPPPCSTGPATRTPAGSSTPYPTRAAPPRSPVFPEPSRPSAPDQTDAHSRRAAPTPATPAPRRSPPPTPRAPLPVTRSDATTRSSRHVAG